MDKNTLRMLQNYPLELKVAKTKARIEEFYNYFNGEVYVSFSGGKDSTVLLHIVRSLYPNVDAVFCDTGLEYPEIKEHVKNHENITVIRPEMSFKEVIDKKGYPVISKQVANTVRLAKQNIKEGKNTLRVRQIKGLEKGSKFNKGKWEFLLDAPFNITEECCNVLKKNPFKKFEKQTNKKAIVGTMAEESIAREGAYLKQGCNSFKNGKSTPLGFWTEQDILEYIYTYNIPIAKIYGEVKKDYSGKYYTTGESRTGCLFCAFGAHLEKAPNRFERLRVTHPNLHSYCIEKLGMDKVLSYVGIKY